MNDKRRPLHDLVLILVVAILFLAIVLPFGIHTYNKKHRAKMDLVPNIVEGSLFFTASPDKTATALIIHTYDADSEQMEEIDRFVIVNNKNEDKLPFFANCLAFSPDSKILAISTSEDNGIEETNTIQFYDLRQNKITKTIPVKQTVYSISYTKKGIIAKADFTTYVINPMTYSLSFQTLPN